MEEVNARQEKPCPFCGEQILAVAIKCKHCGSVLGGAGGAQIPEAVVPATTPAAAVELRQVNITRTAIHFALGAVPGLLFFALLSLAGMFHGRGGLVGHADGLLIQKLLVFVPILVVVVGLPFGFLFGAALRKVRLGTEVQSALVIAAGLAVVLGFVFTFLLEVQVGWEVQNSTGLYFVGAVTAAGGAFNGNRKGRIAAP